MDIRFGWLTRLFILIGALAIVSCAEAPPTEVIGNIDADTSGELVLTNISDNVSAADSDLALTFASDQVRDELSAITRGARVLLRGFLEVDETFTVVSAIELDGWDYVPGSVPSATGGGEADR